jgi:hypothetical protein
MGDYKDLLAYKKAFDLAMEIFQVTRNFHRRKNMR